MSSRRYFDASSILGLAALAEMGKTGYESSANDKKEKGGVRNKKLTPAQEKQKAKNRKKRKNKKR